LPKGGARAGRPFDSFTERWENGFVKTTVEIPDELFRRAKAQAALKGIKLKDLVAEGLRLALAGADGSSPRRRVKFPLLKSNRPGSLKLTGEQIAEIETRQEAEQYAPFVRR
jgi:hypothetical protein